MRSPDSRAGCAGRCGSILNRRGWNALGKRAGAERLAVAGVRSRASKGRTILANPRAVEASLPLGHAQPRAASENDLFSVASALWVIPRGLIAFPGHVLPCRAGSWNLEFRVRFETAPRWRGCSQELCWGSKLFSMHRPAGAIPRVCVLAGPRIALPRSIGAAVSDARQSGACCASASDSGRQRTLDGRCRRARPS
jgi:hypothetical protein